MSSLTYAVEQRLRMIDFLLEHYGKVGRSELMNYFGIAEACATRDFQRYLELAPGNAAYDAHARCYLKGAEFKRLWK